MQARITWYGQECEAAARVNAMIIGTPGPARLPNPVPTLPANASNNPFPDVSLNVTATNDTTTAEGSNSTTVRVAGEGDFANGTAIEFTETIVALEPCGGGVCVTNYGQCAGCDFSTCPLCYGVRLRLLSVLIM